MWENTPCPKKCEDVGACSSGITVKEKKRLWMGKVGYHEFIFLTAELAQASCSMQLENNETEHSGPCKCASKSHRCRENCPCCGQLCFEDYGHESKHFSPNHRNMEYCIFASSDKDEKIQLKNESKQYEIGERATPERCNEHCLRKGRGH